MPSDISQMRCSLGSDGIKFRAGVRPNNVENLFQFILSQDIGNLLGINAGKLPFVPLIGYLVSYNFASVSYLMLNKINTPNVVKFI
jgi:hypothetical protein